MINNNNYNEIRSLILKSIMNDLKEVEKERLDQWLNTSIVNRQLFEELTSGEQLILQMEKLKDVDYQGPYRSFLKEKKRRKRNHILSLLTTFSTLAATLLIAIFIINQQDDSPSNKSDLASLKKLNYKINDPQLILDSGKTIRLVQGKIDSVLDENNLTEMITNKENCIQYANKITTNDLQHNILSVPKNMKYCVILSDGTKAWLNSCSVLRYPVAFREKERKVYAVGEVLFEVAKNDKSPFIVVSNGLNIEVTGTIFNLKNYSNEAQIQLTLLEGGVKAYNYFVNCRMTINQQFTYNKKNKEHYIETVNAESFINWRNRLIPFNRASLNEIIQLIERNYDVVCQVNSTKYKGLEITGVLDQQKDLLYFLNQLTITSNLVFKLEGNRLTIY